MSVIKNPITGRDKLVVTDNGVFDAITGRQIGIIENGVVKSMTTGAAIATISNGSGGSVDLSFITAGAEDILEGKVGADADGNPVYGTLIIPGGAEFYKCAAVYGPYDVETVVFSGCPVAEANGEYLPTDKTTTNWDGTLYPVYANATGWYYYYSEFGGQGISQDYTASIKYSGSIGSTWYDWDMGGEISGMTAVNGTATLDADVPKTWDGYKAVLSNGVYTFEETLTEGLTYSDQKPKKYGIYNDGANIKLDWLIQGYPTDGLTFYASFTDDLTLSETWHDMTNKKAELATVDGVKCVKFDADQWSKIDVITPPAVYSGSGYDYTFFFNFRVNSDQIGGRFFSIGNSGDYYRRIYFKFSEEGGSWKVNIRQGGDDNNISFAANRDVWNTIVITSTAETKKLIIRLNNAVVAELNANTVISDNYAGFGYVGDDYASGYLNNVMVYNRALSEAEIGQLVDKFGV